jgi:hypothetical protein
MSETPFRVEFNVIGGSSAYEVVGPNGRVGVWTDKLVANTRAHIANRAWVDSNGPDLTRQRDEAVALLREADAWLSLCAHRLASETPKVGEPSRAEILAMCTKIAAALRRGEGK